METKRGERVETERKKEWRKSRYRVETVEKELLQSGNKEWRESLQSGESRYRVGTVERVEMRI